MKICILGFGREGKSSLNYAMKKYEGAEFIVADGSICEIPDGVEGVFGSDYLSVLEKLGEGDLVFKTAGMSWSKVEGAKCKVTTQVEVFFEKNRDRVIGVTGTKGKSTTSSMVAAILSKSRDVKLVGNIGVPCLDEIDFEGWFVIELSSYQLEGINVSPHVAVWTNIFPCHLEFHGSYPKYVDAKRNIYKHQVGGDLFLYNSDFVEISGYGGVSFVESNEAYFDDEAFYAGGLSMDRDELPFAGDHNMRNACAAALACKYVGVTWENVFEGLREFKSLPHRQEVFELNGKKFVNDSIATVFESVAEAVKVFGPELDCLILGGVNKDGDPEELVKVLAEHNVQEIILLDDMSRLRFKHPCSVVNFSGMDIEDLNRELGKVVHGLVKEGRCGLFSPGGTSFNMFSNFEVRGEWFKNLMKKSTSK